MRAALTCECDVPGCDGAPMAHLCEDHMPLPAPDVQAETLKRPPASGATKHACDGSAETDCPACDAIDAREDALHPIINPIDGSWWQVAPDVQAQIDAARAQEREACAKLAEWIWDSGNAGAHGGEQANRTAAAIRARSGARGV